MRDETELEAARRARDSILANISHEFRTPLAAQLASIELLQDNLQDMPREQLEELVSSLQRGTLRLTRLIDNLLESVRIESGQLGDPRSSTCDARARSSRTRGELVGGPAGAARPVARSRRCRRTCRAGPGDAPRLTQVFVNLLANANKFGPEGSTIRVGGERDGGEVERLGRGRGPRRRRARARLDLRALLPCRGPGARAARPGPRAVDREVDRRAARRPRRAPSARRPGARGSRSRCRSPGAAT